MARKQELRVVISGDTSQLNRALSKSGQGLDKFGKQTSLTGRVTSKGFAGIAVGARGAAAGVGALTVAGAYFVKQATESEKIAKQTQAVLKSTGGAANVTAKQVEGLATAISRKTGVDDEAIQSAENLLLTFTKVRNETGKGNDVFNQATETIVDMSAALGQDTKASAIQLGKALNDPIKGVTALQRVGVSFTKSQRDQIKTLVESGKTLDAQKLILRELNTEFGGSAEAQAQPMDKLKVAAGNLAETVGRGLKPATDAAATSLTRVIERAQRGGGIFGRFERAANRASRELGSIAKRKDLDLGQKLALSTASLRRNFAPLGREITIALRRAKLGEKFGQAVEVAAPAIVDAIAASAPRAAVTFVKAFKNAGPWGQLLTAGFIIGKLGGFNAAGSWAASTMAKKFKERMARTTLIASAGDAAGATASAHMAEGLADQLPRSMNSRSARFNTSLRRVGRIAGRGLVVGMMAGVALALPDLLKSIQDSPVFAPQKWGESLGRKLGKFLGKGDVAEGFNNTVAALPQGGGGGGGASGGGLAPAAARGLSQINSTFGGVSLSSGRRSVAENRRVGGAPNSDHLSGLALDLVPSGGWSPAGVRLMDRIAAWARRRPNIRWIGWRGVPGHGPGDHLHLSFRPSGGGARGPARRGAGDVVDKLVAFGGKVRGIGDVVGRFVSTSYGPPWGGINGMGVTANGTNLKGAPKIYGVAADPSVLPMGSRVKIRPNPFGYSGAFRVFDTGGAIKGRRIDFYDWRGRKAQMSWGRKTVTVSTADDKSGGGGGGGGSRRGTTLRPGGPSTSYMAPGVSLTQGGGGDYEQQLAESEADIARGEYRQDTGAQLLGLKRKEVAVRSRLSVVNRALRKKGLRKATRLRLTQERTSLLGELGQVRSSRQELLAPRDTEGGGDDPNQALIDAINAKAEQDRELAEQQAALERERIESFNALKASLDAVVNFANGVSAVTSVQAVRALSDTITGELGGRVAARSALPAAALAARY